MIAAAVRIDAVTILFMVMTPPESATEIEAKPLGLREADAIAYTSLSTQTERNCWSSGQNWTGRSSRTNGQVGKVRVWDTKSVGQKEFRNQNRWGYGVVRTFPTESGRHRGFFIDDARRHSERLRKALVHQFAKASANLHRQTLTTVKPEDANRADIRFVQLVLLGKFGN